MEKRELKKPIAFPEVDASGEPKGFASGWKTLYADTLATLKKRWVEKALAYEKDPADFYTAWCWLNQHPIFWYYGSERQHISTLADEQGVAEGLDIRLAMVDRATRVTEGPMENRELEIWVEVMATSFTPGALNTRRMHDYLCDTGAPTYELTIVEVAKLVYDRHGHDRQVIEEMWKSA